MSAPDLQETIKDLTRMYNRACANDYGNYMKVFGDAFALLKEQHEHIQILKEQAACTYLHQAGIACIKCGWFSEPPQEQHHE